jgi:hypothetical protein
MSINPIKPILSIIFLLLTTLLLPAQDKNPFQSIGKKGKIVTLTNGRYEELFDQDSIQQIGTVLVNIRQMKVVKLLKDEKEAQRLLDNSTGSRFLSVDPIAKDYPWYTPYQFAGNMPILARDLDGLEPLFPWNPPGWFWQLKMWAKYGDPTGAKTIVEGTEQKANAQAGNNSYHNDQVPESVQQKLDNINDKAGTGKVLNGSGQLVDWTINRSIDVISVMIPLEEGIVITGRALGTLLKFSPRAQAIAVKTAERLMIELPKGQLPRAVSVIVDRKTGRVYEGISGGIKSLDEVHPGLRELLPEKSLEKWPVTNCAECDALNKALHDGAELGNLEMHTMKIDKKTGKATNFEKCNNCKITTKDIKTTSEKKK